MHHASRPSSRASGSGGRPRPAPYVLPSQPAVSTADNLSASIAAALQPVMDRLGRLEAAATPIPAQMSASAASPAARQPDLLGSMVQATEPVSLADAQEPATQPRAGLDPAAWELLCSGLALSSCQAYSTAQHQYEQFAAMRRLTPYPVSELSLLNCLAHRQSTGMSVSSLRVGVHALRYYHIMSGLDTSVFTSPKVKRLLQGALRLESPSAGARQGMALLSTSSVLSLPTCRPHAAGMTQPCIGAPSRWPITAC